MKVRHDPAGIPITDDDAYDQRLQESLAQRVWSHPSTEHSWYQNREGRVTILSPWRLLDYWKWTREPDLEDYHLW